VFDRNGGFHSQQHRARIGRQIRQAGAVDFFKPLTGQKVQEMKEKSLPEHRERLYPPTVALSMFLKQSPEVDRSCERPFNVATTASISLASITGTVTFAIRMAGEWLASIITARIRSGKDETGGHRFGGKMNGGGAMDTRRFAMTCLTCDSIALRGVSVSDATDFHAFPIAESDRADGRDRGSPSSVSMVR
jgi:hypothetical protein